MAALGANVVGARYHRDGKIVTTAGVSAGIDGALFLARLIAGEDVAKTIQLGIEYAPEPLSGGTPDTARPEIRDRVTASRRSRPNTLRRISS